MPPTGLGWLNQDIEVYPEATTRRMIKRMQIGLKAIILFLSFAVIGAKADDSLSTLRLDMVNQVIANIAATHEQTGIQTLDAKLVAALTEVPRHAFVPEELRPFAYFDIPLPVGHEQNIAQPFLIALMTALAKIGPDDVIFETGTGAGYHAAILSHLAQKVYSVEVVKPLAAAAAERLGEMGYDNVAVRHADGFYGWKAKGPFDAMIIKEAVPQVPATLVNQLKPGGRLVAPIGLPDRGQMLTVIEKTSAGELIRTPLIPVRFSPLQGGERI